MRSEAYYIEQAGAQAGVLPHSRSRCWDNAGGREG